MEMKTFKSDSKEIFVENGEFTVTVNAWANMEGCNLMAHSKDTLAIRMAGAFRWEEVDVILVALTAARSS